METNYKHHHRILHSISIKLTISPRVAIDPAKTVASPIFQSATNVAMNIKSPEIGLFTKTGLKKTYNFTKKN